MLMSEHGVAHGSHQMAKKIFLTFFNKWSPRRLILLIESAETSCMISSEVNLSMGILIRGRLTAKVFFAERTTHLYKKFCLSVGPSVRLSVHCYFRTTKNVISYVPMTTNSTWTPDKLPSYRLTEYDLNFLPKQTIQTTFLLGY